MMMETTYIFLRGLFNHLVHCLYLKFLVEGVVRYEPWGFGYTAQQSILYTLYDVEIGFLCYTLDLNTIQPGGLDYYHVDTKFIGQAELGVVA